MWWTCDVTVDSQLLVSISTPAGPLLDRTFPIHIARTVSKTFGGIVTEKPVAEGLPDWMAQAVLEKVKGVLDEDAVRTAVVARRAAAQTASFAAPDIHPSAPASAPALKPALPDVQSSAASNHPVSSEVASASALGTVTLHVYRTRKFVSLPTSFEKSDIYIDGNKMAQIKSGQTIRMLLAPGKHTIGALGGRAKNDGPISGLDMAAGDEVWVRADYYMSANGFGRLHLKVVTVPSGQAHTESAQLEEVQTEDLHKK